MTGPVDDTNDTVVVSHFHWDREWYRTMQSFRARLVDAIDQVLDPVEPGPVERGVGELDIVRFGPVADPTVLLRGQVRAEVVEHDRDPHLGRMQAA